MIDAADIQEIFFCLPSQATTDLVISHGTYCDMWPTLPASDKALNMCDFWRSKANVWPDLAVLGQWYAEILTSSIACERVFGRMRTLEDSLRMSMGEPAFQAEMSFRANHWVLEQLLDRNVQQLRALPGFDLP